MEGVRGAREGASGVSERRGGEGRYRSHAGRAVVEGEHSVDPVSPLEAIQRSERQTRRKETKWCHLPPLTHLHEPRTVSSYQIQQPHTATYSSSNHKVSAATRYTLSSTNHIKPTAATKYNQRHAAHPGSLG